jgi:hypothetical protein
MQGRKEHTSSSLIYWKISFPYSATFHSSSSISSAVSKFSTMSFARASSFLTVSVTLGKTAVELSSGSNTNSSSETSESANSLEVSIIKLESDGERADAASSTEVDSCAAEDLDSHKLVSVFDTG